MKEVILSAGCVLLFTSNAAAQAAAGAAPSHADPPVAPSVAAQPPAGAANATELQTAQAQAATATDEAATATKDNKEKQSSLDLAKSGKLMSAGVTVGVAFALETPVPGGGAQKTSSAVAMAYLMMLPGYFGTPQPLREYCASAWGVGDDADATAAASGAARKTARKLLDALEADLRIKRPNADVMAAWFPDSGDSEREKKYAEAVVAQITLAQSKSADPKTKAEGNALEESTLDSLTAHAWNPTLRGNCFWRSFGVWLGRPSNYSAVTRFDSDPSNVDRDVKPVFSFGLGYTPHAYFSLLLGFTLSNTKGPEATDSSTWATTVAVGGNLDLVGSLFK